MTHYKTMRNIWLKTADWIQTSNFTPSRNPRKTTAVEFLKRDINAHMWRKDKRKGSKTLEAREHNNNWLRRFYIAKP